MLVTKENQMMLVSPTSRRQRHRFRPMNKYDFVYRDSKARPNMQRNEETRQVCDDIDRIYELGKSLQLVILDCDMINNPIQLEKSGLMPITVFIKISDPNVLKRLIKTRGRNQIRSMGVQTMAAEKLCQCDPVS